MENIKTIRFKKLTEEQKTQIYAMGRSGKYYINEIMEKFHITRITYQKVINEIEYILRNVTPYKV